jgi:hypothetical protein
MLSVKLSDTGASSDASALHLGTSCQVSCAHEVGRQLLLLGDLARRLREQREPLPPDAP